MDPLQFRLTTAQFGDRAYVMTLAGELDLANAQEIDTELVALTGDGARQVIVDLLEVPFVESRVLGVLLRHVRGLRTSGGELTLVADDARVLRVLDITGLESHFRIERTLGAAIDGVLEEVVP